jgi:amidophosphoribosyltransferase
VFDTSCFSGVYVTGDVTPEYLRRLATRRNDAAKQRHRAKQAADAEILAEDEADRTDTAVGM